MDAPLNPAAAAALPGAAPLTAPRHPLLTPRGWTAFAAAAVIIRARLSSADLDRIAETLALIHLRNHVQRPAGLLPARPGSVTFEDVDVTKLPPYQRARLGLGYVPQGREIFPRLTVEENLRLGLATKPAGTPIPPRIFEMFPVLADTMQRRGGDLSGGQQQQLAIGRALAMAPKLLVLADHYVVLSRGEVIKAGKGADMERDGVRECLTVWRGAPGAARAARRARSATARAGSPSGSWSARR